MAVSPGRLDDRFPALLASLSMPAKLSAAKRHRQDGMRRLRNRAVRSRMRTAIRSFVDSLDGEQAEAAERLGHAVCAVDKAASKGVVHRRTAARYKRRLAGHLRRRFAPT